MQLKTARVRQFKCIEDSEEFALDQITCLVGKNEAGKTALLEALYKLNPWVPAHGMFKDLEYPRSKWRPSMESSELPRNALQTKWELSRADRVALEKHFGVDALRSDEVVIEKGYDIKSRWTIRLDEQKIVKHLVGNAGLSAPEGNKLRSISSVEVLIKTLEGMERTSKQGALLTRVKALCRRGTAGRAAIDVLSERLPKFLYFSDYYILPGQVAMDAFVERRAEDDLSIPDRVFEALLSLAGTSPEGISDIATFDRLRASLEAVSNRLTDEIFEYWSQNAHLDVAFSFDHARPDDAPPFNEGYVFRTAIRNRRHKSTVSFDERSSGFVWFFSFLVWFSQVRDEYGDNLILLLDEPALNLHARAQADLLRYFDERLAPSFQLVYTTHSPFMINPDKLLSARTVEDVARRDSRGREELLGTKVRDDVLAVDRDTVSPLQAAVGYDITQTLFVGKHTLVVEGPSDLLYLKWFSERAKEAGVETLDKRWTICPVGGIDKVNSFAALFAANALNIAVLVDLQKGQKAKVRSLRQSSLLRSGSVFTPDMYVDGAEEGDTEDLIGWENYRLLVNECYGLEGSNRIRVDAYEDGRILDPIEREMALVKGDIPEFDHYAPAEHLVGNTSALLKKLPELEEALERFVRFFKEVNECLPGR